MRRFVRSPAALIVLSALTLLTGPGPLQSTAHAGPPDASARVNELHTRWLTLVDRLNKGDLDVLDEMNRIMDEAMELAPSDPKTQDIMSNTMIATVGAMPMRFKKQLAEAKPTGAKMTGMWAQKLSKELIEEAEDTKKSKDRIAKLEQAYVYIAFAAQDVMESSVSDTRSKLLEAYKAAGMKEQERSVRLLGKIPTDGHVVPDIVMSQEAADRYRESATKASAGDWKGAFEAQKKVIAELDKLLPPDSPEFVDWWFTAGDYASNANLLDEARTYLGKAEARVAKVYGPDSKEMIDYWNSVTMFHTRRGDMGNAMAARANMFAAARKQPLGDAHAFRMLTQSVHHHTSSDELKEAKAAMRDLDKRYEKSGDTFGPDLQLGYTVARHYLAVAKEDWGVATSTLDEAAKWAQKIDDRAAKFKFRRTAAEYYAFRKEYASAAVQFREAATIGSAVPIVTANMYERAANAYWATGRFDEAAAMMDESAKRYDAALPESLLSGTEKEKRQQQFLASTSLHSVMSLAKAMPKDERMANVALRTLVRRKAIVLDSEARARDLVRKHGTPGETEEKLAEHAKYNAQWAALLYHPEPAKAFTPEEIRTISGMRTAYDRALSNFAADYVSELAQPDVETVREALPSKGALVEFVRFIDVEPGDEESAKDPSAQYAALVLTPSGAPSVVSLGSAEAIDAQIAALVASTSTSKGNYDKPARELYGSVFAKIAPYLGDAEHLVLAPDGDLNLLPFGALVDGDGKFVLERYTLSYAATGGDLVRPKADEQAEIGPILLGAPAFDDTSKGSTDKRRFLDFKPLPGSKEEIDGLAELLPSATVMTGTEADENTLKSKPRPTVLHMATHGFFLGSKSKAIEGARALEIVDDGASSSSRALVTAGGGPLLRSGLALAGANLRTGTNDGILTALEVTNMDLRGTELVVLSACETGVGEVESGEGVYGLRRALVVAGSRSQVMSLWKVSDAATRDLMLSFYGKLKEGEGRASSLRDAQLELMKTEERRHPYYWAAFIPSGEWDPMSFDPGGSSGTGTGSNGRRDDPRPTSIRQYRKQGFGGDSLFQVFAGYSRPAVPRTLDGVTAEQGLAFDLGVDGWISPRFGLRFMYALARYDVGAGGDRNFDTRLRTNRLEFGGGVDLLALPTYWKVRPSLNALVGVGIGWAKDDRTGTDPMMSVADGEWALGLGAVWAGDFGLSFRVGRKAELKLFGGATQNAYWFNADKTIAAGKSAPGRAIRWNAGLAIGFQNNR